jgi:hypothetical protein
MGLAGSCHDSMNDHGYSRRSRAKIPMRITQHPLWGNAYNVDI